MKLSELPSHLLVSALYLKIDQGELDEELTTLINKAINRRLTVRQIKANELAKRIKPGDTVKIQAGIKPKYMANRVGKVIARQGMKATIEFPFPVGRFGSRVIIPLSCLDVLKVAETDDIEVDLDDLLRSGRG